MIEKGYKHVGGVDNCEELIRSAKNYFGEKAEFLIVSDGIKFLIQHPNKFDGIFLVDVIEHFTFESVFRLFRAALTVLKPDGRIIIRTPNMGNISGISSRYMYLTHLSGFTDWNLVELLDIAGFIAPRVYLPNKYTSRKRAIAAKSNSLFHKLLYKLQDRKMPITYGKNIVAMAKKGYSFSRVEY